MKLLCALLILCFSLPTFASEIAPAKDAIIGDMITPPADLSKIPEDAIITYSGLAMKIITKGVGKTTPKLYDRVKIDYTGWKTDGSIFDSSVKRGYPASFDIFDLTPSWQEALIKMKVGEHRRLWVPEKLSKESAGSVPDGMLVFDIILLDIVKKEVEFQ